MISFQEKLKTVKAYDLSLVKKFFYFSGLSGIILKTLLKEGGIEESEAAPKTDEFKAALK